MKKILPFLILFLASVATLSQNLYVKSLTLDENNLKAQINLKFDVNNKKCCVIMISTPNMDDAQRRKLKFEGGDAGSEVVSQDFPTGEIEIYFSPHASSLKIMHPDLGILIYDIPIDLKEMKTYNMVLMSAKATTIIEESLTHNYLVINVEPKDARVFIDEEFVENKNGAVSKFLSVGVEHSLRIVKNLYHPLDTMVMTNADSTVTINKKLKPAFGYIEVNSLPESGAKVIIDDNEVGITPYKSGQMASGEYNVQVVKAMYKQSSKIVRVIDGNTTEVSLAMQPNFAEITLTTDSESAIYLDEKMVGKGKWTGRVQAGSHIVEVKKENHRDVKRTIIVEASKNDNIVIDNPIPICGSLNITSEPLDATIYLDNKEVGKTPKILTQVLIGSHTIRIEKSGYSSFAKEINVKEGVMSEVEGKLSNQKIITIGTGKDGDVVYIDGEKVGVTPYNAKFDFGEHTVKAERNGISATELIFVNSSSNPVLRLNIGGRIKVSTEPNSAKIFVGNKLYGTSPQSLDVPIGNYVVKAVWNNNSSSTKDVYVESGETTYVTLKSKNSYKKENDRTKSNNRSKKYSDYKSKTTFITLDFAYSIAPQASFGLTIGQVKKIGWYASVSTNFKFKAMGAKFSCDENGAIDGINPFYSGESSKSRLSITGGVLIGFSDKVYFKIGAGYGCRAFAQQTTDGTWIKNKAYSTSGIDLCGGFQFLFGKFNMSADVLTTNFKYAEIKIGLGINF